MARCRLSELVGHEVTTLSGRAIGGVDDVAVRLRPREYPLVTGIVADTGSGTALFDRDALTHGPRGRLTLRRDAVGIVDFAIDGDEVLLRRDVVGSRLPELATTDVLRACDVELRAEQDNWILSGVYTRPPRWFGRDRGRAGGFRDWGTFAPLTSRRSRPSARAPHGDFPALLRTVTAAGVSDAIAAASAVSQRREPATHELLPVGSAGSWQPRIG